MSAPTPLRRELLFSLSILFGGALVLAVAGLFLVLPFIEGPGDAVLLAGFLLAADLAILFLFARALVRRNLLQPLEAMVRDSRRIAEGDYRHRMALEGTEELNALAESVNAMADRLIRDQGVLARNIRSLDETNRELVAARDEVVRTARLASVGTLAAGLAHEVGNPLGAIIGYLDVARRRGETGGEVGELVDAAHDEARRIDRIIRSLLNYARPQPEVEGAIHPSDVVERVRRLLEAQGRLESVEVEWAVPDDLPGVLVDPHHLEQVLVNLLLNALDAIEGSLVKRIRVRAREEPWTPPVVPFRRQGDPPGTNYAHRRRIGVEPAGARGRLLDAQQVVVLSVEDSGPGIPRENLGQLFDPFFTTKDPGKGTGLGLAICARLVEEMGGRIEVRSSEGAGATFQILLPTGRGGGEAEETGEIRDAAASPGEPGNARGGKAEGSSQSPPARKGLAAEAAASREGR